MDIFHGNHSTRSEILYSVVNLVEPGTFPNGDAGRFSTPGVVLFLQVSACSQPLESFNEMLRVARVLAASLDGELLGPENRILTNKNIQVIRKSLWPVQADLYTGPRD
jgi:cell division protein ZipA